MKDADNAMLEKIEAKNGLESAAVSAKARVASLESEDDKKFVTEEAQKVLDWVMENEHASKEEIDDRRKEFDEVTQPIFAKAQDTHMPDAPVPEAGGEREEAVSRHPDDGRSALARRPV